MPEHQNLIILQTKVDRRGVDDLELDSNEVNRLVFSTPMAAQDFQEQKGCLQEELEAPGQEVIFYFHCELNFIDKFWCSCKAYTWDHFTFTIQDRRKILPGAVKSVLTATINR
jgi:hypothetical protein